MHRPSCSVRILDSDFVLECDDVRWIRFLGQIWEPFAQEPSHERSESRLIISQQANVWTVEGAGLGGFGSHDAGGVAGWIRNALFRRALEDAKGLSAIHASAVERDGVAVLLAGNSGVGKTTLALEMLRSGWKVVADDLVPIRHDGTITPFFKPLSVKDSSSFRDWYHESWTWPEDPDAAYLIPVSALPRTVQVQMSISTVIFPTFELGRPRGALEIVSPGIGLAESIRHLYRSTPEVVRSFSKATTGSAWWSIRFGSPDQAMHELQSMLLSSYAVGG